jgi:hypothetical protein
MELSKEQRIQAKAEKRATKAAGRGEYSDLVVSLDPNEPITVLCVRFGNKYGREYVERLRNMVSRHLTVPYEFACLTDDQHDIAGVRKIYQPNANYARGWWHKVHMFDSALPLRGRILYLDLDVVIHANMNKLTGYHPTSFIGIHDFNRKFFPSWNYLNSSVLAWTHGTQGHIYDQFNGKYFPILKLYQLEYTNGLVALYHYLNDNIHYFNLDGDMVQNGWITTSKFKGMLYLPTELFKKV